MDMYQKRIAGLLIPFIVFLAFMALTACAVPPSLMFAPTPDPHPGVMEYHQLMNVHGSATIDGAPAPDSAKVSAMCGENLVPTADSMARISATDGEASFGVVVFEDDPNTVEVDGCRDGDMVYFYVGNVRMAQSIPWVRRTTVNLDLSGRTQVTPYMQPVEPYSKVDA